MTCDHTAGLDVRSELVLELDDVSGQDAHNYVLDVQSVVCRGCGGEFSIGAARGIAQSARTGGQTAAQQAAADQAIAIQGARGITSQAAQALQQAGALGTTAAQQGIAGLAGTTGAFDPRSAQTFVNQ